jgi:hypothetical protein
LTVRVLAKIQHTTPTSHSNNAEGFFTQLLREADTPSAACYIPHESPGCLLHFSPAGAGFKNKIIGPRKKWKPTRRESSREDCR